MAPSPARPSAALADAARSLAVDVVTAEVSGALTAASIRCLLLKGPSIARWLYAPGESRPYVDTDLLVAPDQLEPAEDVLRRLGFAARLEPEDTPGWRRPSREWLRPGDDANVDLHRTLAGVGVDASVVWGSLATGTEHMRVCGRQIEILGVPARALHVVLHAAQHGHNAPGPVEDLRRAVSALTPSRWEEVVTLAERLGAEGSLAAGLRLVPDGAGIAAAFDLPEPSVEAALLAADPPPVAVALVHFTELRGLGPRLRFLARKLVPTPRYLRAWSPLARRGAVGLLLAYLWRPLWLLLHTPAGVQAWARARREAAPPGLRRP